MIWLWLSINSDARLQRGKLNRSQEPVFQIFFHMRGLEHISAPLSNSARLAPFASFCSTNLLYRGIIVPRVDGGANPFDHRDARFR